MISNHAAVYHISKKENENYERLRAPIPSLVLAYLCNIILNFYYSITLFISYLFLSLSGLCLLLLIYYMYIYLVFPNPLILLQFFLIIINSIQVTDGLVVEKTFYRHTDPYRYS